MSGTLADWCNQNSQLANNASAASQQGRDQFDWLGAELAAAAGRDDAVHILGHQPPSTGCWTSHFPRYMALCAKYKDTIKGQFFGHIHTDQWALTRECVASPPGAPYVETTKVKWCSGGGNYAPGDAFGAGVDGLCPLAPDAWTDAEMVAGCERVCSSTTECVGFTQYAAGDGKTRHRSCCFRTDSVASKPACTATVCAKCYEKPPAESCDGAATGVIIPGPSLTEGFPATNPSVRELIFDSETFELLDMNTWCESDP